MANQIPLAEGSSAAGGVLVPDVARETLIKKFLQESAVAQVVQSQRVSGKTFIYPVYMGRPTVSTVAEGAAKPVTGAEYTPYTINIKKAAGITVYTDELLADARENPEVLVTSDIEAAFAQWIDSNSLGFANGASITSDFNTALTATTSAVELGTGGDAFAVAVSSAMSTIESNGGRPTAIIAASDVRGLLRDARATVETASPVFTNGFQLQPDNLYGLPIVYTSNLDALPAGAGKVAAVVLDASQARLLIAEDISMTRSTESAVTIGGTLTSLFEHNLTAARWEMRAGFGIYDVNRNVVKITNAS